MISFDNQNILITGAAHGIGKCVAQKMAALDAHLFLMDQDVVALDVLKESLTERPGRGVSVYPGDISDNDYVCRTIDQITECGASIHHIIHCAGIYPDAMMQDTSDDLWRKVMAINADSTFFVSRAVAPHLAHNSSIVAITSLAAHRGNFNHSHYSASKGAVASFCKSIALELAPNTRVNVIAPGMIRTGMTEHILDDISETLQDSTPMKRIGTPEDVANAVMFLCSELAAFITGQTIHVNGGLYIT